MNKKNILLVFLLFVVLGGWYFAQDYFKNRFDAYEGNLANVKKHTILHRFLLEHDKEVVYLSLTFSKELNQEFKEELLRSPSIHLNSFIPLDEKKVTYIISIREDGKRDFLYDENSSKLEGLFQTYIQEKDKNQFIINLLSLSPKEVKKLNN